MRNLSFLVLTIFAIIFVGCSKDDGNDAFNYNKDNLLGKYSLKSWEMSEEFTEEVRGFPVTTTEVYKGDTFSVTYTFDEDDTVTIDGSFRMTKKKTQNGQTKDTAYIVIENRKIGYLVKASLKQLEMQSIKYDVKDFNPRGFKISHQEESEINGIQTKRTISAEFKR